MTGEETGPSEREIRLREVVLEYEKARDAGRAPDLRELIDRHPDLAEDLSVLIPAQNPLAPLAELLRWSAAEGYPAAPAGYEIVAELGRGGQSVVYKARQQSLERDVALKMIRTGADASPEERERFRADANALARLRHPMIVQIYEIGEHQGQPFFSLEYVEGGNLAERLGRVPQSPTWAAEKLAPLAHAMQTAHEQNIIHRDLKPANILLTKDETPKITDFGLAKLLDDGVTQTLSSAGPGPGTLPYMAPEQVEGRASQVGRQSDVYALGVILYEMLTGHPPFQGPTPVDTLLQIQTQRPVPPSRQVPTVPPALERICLMCLEKQLAQRYASAQHLAEDLEDHLKELPPRHARPKSFWEWVVDLFSRSTQAQHFSELAGVHLWLAPVELLVHLGVFILLRLAGPEPLVWLLIFGPYVILFALIHRIASLRVRLLTPIENLARILWLGHMLGYAAICLGSRLTTSDYVIAVQHSYSALAVLTGLAYLVLGGIYWSRYYLFASTWLVVTFFVTLLPSGAPLLYGLYNSMSGLAIGLWLWRAGRAAGPGEAC